MYCRLILRTLSSQCSITEQITKSVPWMQRFAVQQTSKAMCTYFSKVSKIPDGGGNEDILGGQIRTASIFRLLQLIETHSSIMNNEHLIHALNSLYYMKKDNKLPNMFVETPSFIKLSKRLRRRAQFFNADEVLSVLKILSFLGMSSSNPLMQTYFQMLRHQIKELPMKQLIFLEYLLKKQDNNPLVEALKMAVPLVIENHLEIQMDKENMNELMRLLKLAVKYNMSEKSVQCICNAMLHNSETLSAVEALDIVWNCIMLKKNFAIVSKLCSRAFEVLNTDCETLLPSQLVKLLSVCNKNFIDSSLVSKVCLRAVRENWSLSLVYTLVTTTTIYKMSSEMLLNYYCDLIVENEKEIKENSKFCLLTIVEAFAKSSFIPRKSAEMLQLITNCEDKLNKLHEKPTIYFRALLCFAVFDCYHPLIFKHINHGYFIESILGLIKEKNSSNLDRDHSYKNMLLKELLLLHQAVTAHGYKLNLPEDIRLMAMKVKQQENTTFPLAPALHGGLGGKNYVLSGIFTRSGLFIDHYIVLRQGEYPIALAKQEQSNEFDSCDVLPYIEDIQIPSDARRIAIIVHSTYSKWSDEVYVTGFDRLLVNLLTQDGFHVIEINLSSWNKLSDAEKIPYLMRKIHCLYKKNSTDTFHLD